MGSRLSSELHSTRGLGACLLEDEPSDSLSAFSWYPMVGGIDRLIQTDNPSSLSKLSSFDDVPNWTCSEIKFILIGTLYMRGPIKMLTESGISSMSSQKSSRSMRSSHLRQFLFALCGNPKLDTIVSTAREFEQIKGKLSRLVQTLSLS